MNSLIKNFGTEQTYQIDKSGLNKGEIKGIFNSEKELKTAVKLFAKINMNVPSKTTITEVSTGNVLFINVK